jgi:hypothetical protein
MGDCRGCTAILIRVAPLIPPNANPLFLNAAIPRMNASYSDDAETVTVCVTSGPSVNDTRQVLDTFLSTGE